MAATMQIHEMSKTYQYRKVMKPMLERKRRARINKCLDELKDLMVATLESEGEHITRLEKADILELTVQHLQKLRQKRKLGLENCFQESNSTLSQAEGFRSGFIYAANEISRNLANLPGINITFGTKLMTHLGKRLNQLQSTATTAVAASTTPITPIIPKTSSSIQINTNLKIPIPIHHPITINCGGSIHNMQTTPNIISSSPSSPSNSLIQNMPYGTYSVQLSPVSNYSQSPKSHIHCELLTTKSENLNSVNGSRLQQEPEDNVWRPW